MNPKYNASIVGLGHEPSWVGKFLYNNILSLMHQQAQIKHEIYWMRVWRHLSSLTTNLVQYISHGYKIWYHSVQCFNYSILNGVFFQQYSQQTSIMLLVLFSIWNLFDRIIFTHWINKICFIFGFLLRKIHCFCLMMPYLLTLDLVMACFYQSNFAIYASFWYKTSQRCPSMGQYATFIFLF